MTSEVKSNSDCDGCRYGCCLCCCCCEDRLPPKAKKIKDALDSIEAYRAHQLEKLRENYNLQVCPIPGNWGFCPGNSYPLRKGLLTLELRGRS